MFESAADYFNAPRSDGERELLDHLTGPVLDLAAGAGSYTVYLQGNRFDVTAAEHSPGAVEVCRARGCRNVVSVDLRTLEIAPVEKAARPGGRLLFTMIDPLDTTDEGHLQYHRRNRERGLPPGLIRMRITYEGVAEDWMHLWMLTEDELRTAASEGGWTLIQERRGGPWRVRLFESTDIA